MRLLLHPSAVVVYVRFNTKCRGKLVACRDGLSERKTATFAHVPCLRVQTQTSVSCLCAHTLNVLYMAHFDRGWIESRGGDVDAEWQTAKRKCMAVVCADVIVGVLAIAFAVHSHELLIKLGVATGVISAATTTFHWGFQIRETHAQGTPGALSLPSLWIMASGSFLTAYSYSLNGTFVACSAVPSL